MSTAIIGTMFFLHLISFIRSERDGGGRGGARGGGREGGQHRTKQVEEKEDRCHAHISLAVKGECRHYIIDC